MSKYMIITSASLVALLGACGGSSTSDEASGGGTPGFDLSENISSLSTRAGIDFLAEELAEDAFTAITLSEQSGTATYTGFAGIDVDEDLVAAGELTLTADFDAAQISGSADNFGIYSVDTDASELPETLQPNETLSGSLTIGSSALTQDTTIEFTAPMTGTLTDQDGGEAVANLSLVGGIAAATDSGVDVAQGSIEGTVVTPDGETITYDVDDDTEGFFLGVEQ